MCETLDLKKGIKGFVACHSWYCVCSPINCPLTGRGCLPVKTKKGIASDEKEKRKSKLNENWFWFCHYIHCPRWYFI